MPHPFLSEEWFTEVDRLRPEVPAPPPVLSGLVVNVVVTGGPWGDTKVHYRAGQLERGVVEEAPTTVTIPYDIAKAVFIDGNQTAAMQAFMSGQIMVQGDMGKLMAMQSAGPLTEEQLAFHRRIKDITS